MNNLIALAMMLVNLIGINFFDGRLDDASMKEKCKAAATNMLEQAEILKDMNSRNKVTFEEYQQTMSSLQGMLGWRAAFPPIANCCRNIAWVSTPKIDDELILFIL